MRAARTTTRRDGRLMDAIRRARARARGGDRMSRQAALEGPRRVPGGGRPHRAAARIEPTRHALGVRCVGTRAPVPGRRIGAGRSRRRRRPTWARIARPQGARTQAGVTGVGRGVAPGQPRRQDGSPQARVTRHLASVAPRSGGLSSDAHALATVQDLPCVAPRSGGLSSDARPLARCGLDAANPARILPRGVSYSRPRLPAQRFRAAAIDLPL